MNYYIENVPWVLGAQNPKFPDAECCRFRKYTEAIVTVAVPVSHDSGCLLRAYSCFARELIQRPPNRLSMNYPCPNLGIRTDLKIKSRSRSTPEHSQLSLLNQQTAGSVPNYLEVSF